MNGVSGPGEPAPNHVELGHRAERGQSHKLRCTGAKTALDLPLTLKAATPMYAQVISCNELYISTRDTNFGRALGFLHFWLLVPSGETNYHSQKVRLLSILYYTVLSSDFCMT